jgi:hypothetical protein
MVLPESIILVGSLRELPMVKITAAVSLTALPMLSITPVRIPGAAEGRMTRVTVSHFVAPKEKLTIFRLFGTALMASSLVLMIVGKTIIATVRVPERRDHPILSFMTKKINPKRP